MPYRSFCEVVFCICFEPERKDRQSFHKFYLQGNVYLYLVNKLKGLEKYCQQIANSCEVFSSRLSGFLTSYLVLGQIQFYCLFFLSFFQKKCVTLVNRKYLMLKYAVKIHFRSISPFCKLCTLTCRRQNFGTNFPT